MRTFSILLGLTGFVTLCVLSFNYVEGHESTRLKKELEEYKLEIERISGEANILNQNKINMEGRLKQACGLLAAAEIANDLCEEEEETEVSGSPEVVTPAAVESDEKKSEDNSDGVWDPDDSDYGSEG